MATTQPSLFDETVELHETADQRRLRKFVEFHLANPTVFDCFCELANELRQHADKGAAREIGEQIRWRTKIKTIRVEGQPKYNDHLWPYYARLLVASEPRFEEFFSTKESFAFTPAEVAGAVNEATEQAARTGESQ